MFLRKVPAFKAINPQGDIITTTSSEQAKAHATPQGIVKDTFIHMEL